MDINHSNLCYSFWLFFLKEGNGRRAMGNANGIQDWIVTDKEIIQTGKHSSADDNVTRYRTKYFRMTTKKYVTEEKFTEGDNADIEYKFVPFTFGDEQDDGTIKYVEYIIDIKDFKSAAAKLGITGDYIVDNGSATVYLNNVFETFIKKELLIIMCGVIKKCLQRNHGVVQQ